MTEDFTPEEKVKLREILVDYDRFEELKAGVLSRAGTYLTQLLKDWPWTSTLVPAIVSAAAMYFAAPAREVAVPGPERVVEKTITREVPVGVVKPKE